MRFMRLSLSYLIILTFFASNVQAIVDPSQVTVQPGQSLADQLIDNSNSGGIVSGDTRFPSTPRSQGPFKRTSPRLTGRCPAL